MAEGPRKIDWKHQIFTIPNLLSLFRLILIPILIWLYIGKKAYGWAFAVVLLSGATDVLDGIIARRFNMVSDLGKALDPVADKLTQGVVLICLGTRFPVMFILVGLMAVKEAVNGLMGLYVIRTTGEVHSAVWHGKLTTVLLYATMLLHILWRGIPRALTILLVVVCAGLMFISLVLYIQRNLEFLGRRKP